MTIYPCLSKNRALDSKDFSCAGYSCGPLGLIIVIFKGTKTELPNLLTELFNDVDNGDGKLTPDELVELEGKLNKTISLEDAEQIITTWDSNGDGFFTVDEYIEYKSAQMN